MMNIGGLTGSTLASFLVTALVIELTPGPNMTYLALVWPPTAAVPVS